MARNGGVPVGGRIPEALSCARMGFSAAGAGTGAGADVETETETEAGVGAGAGVGRSTGGVLIAEWESGKERFGGGVGWDRLADCLMSSARLLLIESDAVGAGFCCGRPYEAAPDCIAGGTCTGSDAGDCGSCGRGANSDITFCTDCNCAVPRGLVAIWFSKSLSIWSLVFTSVFQG